MIATKEIKFELENNIRTSKLFANSKVVGLGRASYLVQLEDATLGD